MDVIVLIHTGIKVKSMLVKGAAGDHFKHAYELLNLRAFKILSGYKTCISVFEYYILRDIWMEGCLWQNFSPAR